MTQLRYFGNSANPVRIPRSPLSSASQEPGADFATYAASGNGQQRGLDSIPGVRWANVPAPSLGIDADFKELRAAARRVAPTAALTLTVTEVEDGFHPLTRRYELTLGGPDVLAPLVLSGARVNDITCELPKAWRTARRAKAVAVLLDELGRLRGCDLTEEQRRRVSDLLTACPDVRAFDKLANRCRAHAKAQGA